MPHICKINEYKYFNTHEFLNKYLCDIFSKYQYEIFEKY